MLFSYRRLSRASEPIACLPNKLAGVYRGCGQAPSALGAPQAAACLLWKRRSASGAKGPTATIEAPLAVGRLRQLHSATSRVCAIALEGVLWGGGSLVGVAGGAPISCERSRRIGAGVCGYVD